jgi:hypothetical protein
MVKLVGVEDGDAVVDVVLEAVDAPAAVGEETEVGVEVSEERSSIKKD